MFQENGGSCRGKAAGEANEEGRKQIRNSLMGLAEAKKHDLYHESHGELLKNSK